METRLRMFLSSSFVRMKTPLPEKYPLFYSDDFKANRARGCLPWSDADHRYAVVIHQLMRHLWRHDPAVALETQTLPPPPPFLIDLYADRVVATLVWSVRPTQMTGPVAEAPRLCAQPAGKPSSMARFRPRIRVVRAHANYADMHACFYAPAPARVRHVSSARLPDTELCRRYARADNCAMMPIDAACELELSPGATHVAVAIFCRVTGAGTIVPVYEVASRGFVSAAAAAAFTTFAGPMTASYSVDRDMNTQRDFDYLPHCVVTLDGSDPVHVQPAAAPSPLVDAATQQAFNAYTETLYHAAERAALHENQSFVYRGLNALVPITAAAYFAPDRVSDAQIEDSLDRLLARRGMTTDEFCALFDSVTRETLRESPTLRLEIKQLVIEAANLVNTLTYRDDAVFGIESDMHENIRLTNCGDCEDAAEGAFRIMRYLYQWKSPRRRDAQSLCEFLRRFGVSPALVHMRVNYHSSNSHTTAAAMVLEYKAGGDAAHADAAHQMYFLEGTTPEHANFCDYAADDDAAWRIKMGKLVSKKSCLDYYKEPCEEHCGGSSFYVGFVGAVVVPPPDVGKKPFYAFFVDPTERRPQDHGVDVCKATIASEYELRDLLAEEGATNAAWAGRAHEGMRFVASFVPPLPPQDECVFPTAQYGTWVDRIRVHEKGRPAGSEQPRRKKAFTVFLNLCITEAQFEKTLPQIATLAAESEEVSVTPFSLFPGAAVVELNFR